MAKKKKETSSDPASELPASADDQPGAACAGRQPPSGGFTYADVAGALRGLIRHLGCSPGISNLLVEPLGDSVGALGDRDAAAARSAIECYLGRVDEYAENLDAEARFEVPGYASPSSFLRFAGQQLGALVPTLAIEAAPLQIAVFAASVDPCIKRCLNNLATCLGISSGALLLCGAGCLPALFFGPGGYASCIAVCAGLAGGVLSGICFKNFIACVRAC